MSLKTTLVASFFLVAFSFGFTNKSVGQDRTELEKMTRDFMTMFFQLQAQDPALDLEKFKAYFSPNTIFQPPQGVNEDLTVDKFIAWQQSTAGNVEGESELKSILVDGMETIILSHWKGTLKKAPNNPENVGKKSSVPVATHLTWEAGKITRMEMYYDRRKIYRNFGWDK